MFRPIRVLLDTGNHFGTNRNLGDVAMLRVLVDRLRAADPDARIHVVTRDPGLLAEWIDDVEPVEVGAPDVEGDRRRDPVADLAPDIDLALLSGGGCFTDAFAPHAWRCLRRLATAAAHGATTGVVGTGFQAVTDDSLRTVAAAVLPGLTLVGCRERLHSPGVLAGFGVAPERIVVTGDDALGLATAAGPGDAIGVSLRLTDYSGVEPPAVAAIGEGVREAAARLGAGFAALPVSLDGPDDRSAIDAVLAGAAAGPDVGDLDDLLAATARCRVAVAGSYHAAVLALSRGASIVAVAGGDYYRAKFEGLADAFPGAVTIVDSGTEHLATSARDALLAAWDGAPARQSDVVAAAREQARAGDAVVARLVAAAGARPRRVSRPRPSALTTGQLEAYDRDGYVGPLDLLTADEVASVRTELGDLLDLEESQWGQRHLDMRAVFDLAADPRVVDWIGSILGPDVVVWNTRFRVKGGGAKEIPWHQDDAYWDIEPLEVTSIWLALDDADAENGCLEMLPGSHRRRMAHAEATTEVHDDFHLTTDTSGLATIAPIPVPMRAGQVLLFSSAVVHRSSPNHSDRRRAAFVARFTTPRARITHPVVGPVIRLRGEDRDGRQSSADPPAPGGVAAPPAPAPFAFDRPFRGGGWYQRERDAEVSFCWTGAGGDPWLDAEVPEPGRAHRVRIEVRHQLAPGGLDHAEVVLGGIALPTHLRHEDGVLSINAEGPAEAFSSGDVVHVLIRGVPALRPATVDPSNPDRRTLGFAASRLVLTPV